MTIYDWILFFIIAALAITSGVSIFWAWEWKRRHNEAVEMWERESEFKTNKIAEEIERDPYLCKVFHSVNTFDCQENIMVRFRMLPYAEGVVWEDLFKKEEE